MKPDTPEYMYRQSSCYARIGDTDNALERYQEAKALDKKDKPVPGRQEGPAGRRKRLCGREGIR